MAQTIARSTLAQVESAQGPFRVSVDYSKTLAEKAHAASGGRPAAASVRLATVLNEIFGERDLSHHGGQ